MEVFSTMAAKKKGLGKVKIKSFKRIVLLTGLLIVAVVALLTVYNSVFSTKSKGVIAQPTATGIVEQVTVNDIVVKKENSDVAIAANASQASRDEAIKEMSESIAKNKGITVKVVNHSRNLGYSEKLRAVLEVNGFSVSAGNDKSLKRVNSVIIEKKDNVSGEGITKLVNIKRVRKELDPDSRFDIVVVIGDDYY